MRLGEDKRGIWKVKNIDKNQIVLIHSSLSEKRLCVELLPNLSITIQSKKKQQALFEKIIIPYGTNADQTCNLLDIAARDIYHAHFDNLNLYLADKRRKSDNRSPTKKLIIPIFDYLYQNQHELKTLLMASKYM